MVDLNGLSISFSSVSKEIQLDYLARKRLDLSELNLLLAKLEHINLNDLKTDNQKKAFWINIYNGLTNYIIVNKKIKRNMVYNLHLLSTFKITIDDYQWSLNHIEHGILRRNSKPLYQFRRPFGKGDPRLKQMLKTRNDRIHFALNCGGTSCPAVRFYNSEEIDQELEIAKARFLEENISVDHANKTISCSPLFKWYKRDFEGKYIFDNLYREFAIKYTNYDWSVDLRIS